MYIPEKAHSHNIRDVEDFRFKNANIYICLVDPISLLSKEYMVITRSVAVFQKDSDISLHIYIYI